MGCPSFFISVDHKLKKNKMIKRTIKIIKPLKKGLPTILPAPVFVELADTVVQQNRTSAVNRWISEWRENAVVEKASSRSKILAWQTKHRLRRNKRA